MTTNRILAMAKDTVAEWLAAPPTDPNALEFARHLARYERWGEDYAGWSRALDLDPEAEHTLVFRERIHTCYIAAMGALSTDEFERRLRVARLEVSNE